MTEQRILVVDDDRDIIDYVQLLLALQGYHVLPYMTTTDVCEQCDQHQPGLIILDLHIHVPHAGWKLVQSIRAQSSTAHIPILLYSSDHEALQVYQGELRTQGCDVLKKPFQPEKLLTMIEALMAGADIRSGPRR